MADEELMTHWDYRVTKQVVAGETEYGIREVYYDRDNKIISWTADVIGAAEETLAEVETTLAKMFAATSKPVIDITDEDNPKEI